MKKRKTILLALIVVLLLVQLACEVSGAKMGWRGESVPGRVAYQYTKFTGIERVDIPAQAGQTLVISYAVKVERGRLFIQVMTPDNAVLWNTMLEADASQTVAFALQDGGIYPLIIRGENTAGGFHIEWELESP